METKIECAIYNAKMKLKNTETEIAFLHKLREYQVSDIASLENIQSDKLLK